MRAEGPKKLLAKMPTRIVVGGAGAIGASAAYNLALLGARDVVLCDRGEVAGGATAKAMGGVRQQFSTAAEVRLAQESISFFERLGPPYFHQVGYLFVATTAAGLEQLERRMALQQSLGVPVERVRVPEGVYDGDVAGAVACWKDGVADPPAVTRELVRRAAELGVRVEEGVDARSLDRDVLVVCCGPHSAELAPELPIRPLCRQLLATGPLDLDERLPMVDPIIGAIGDGVYTACGFSGHGFMQSPAVGRALAEEIVLGESALDLTPYRLDRFAGEAAFPETLVL